MNKNYIKPPKLSMNFNENKKDIKKRFSNILDSSNKKNGILTLVIVLMLIITAGVFITVSTNKNEKETNILKTFANKYNLGEEIEVDLNGDGIKEKVYYGKDDFKINSVSYKELVQNEIYEDNPREDCFLIADINEKDNQKEIALLTNGPSDDPMGFFYTYNNNGLIKLGNVPSNLDINSFDGKGNIAGNLRLSVLQTWWAPAIWKLNKDDNIKLKEENIYYPIQYEGSESLMLVKELPVHTNLTDSSNPLIMKPQEVKITKTDNKQFCYVEGLDGTKGWFEVADFYNIVELDNVPATDVFEGLSMVD